MFRLKVMIFPLAGLVLANPVGALDIDNFSPAANDRFANDPLFIAGAYDLSGVGRDHGLTSGGKWGTMVSRNVFLSAHHFRPATGNDLIFYPGNDPSAPQLRYEIAGGQRIGSTDIWMGYLAEPVSSQVQVYSFASTPLVDNLAFAASDYFYDDAFQSGNTGTRTGYGASIVTRHAVGENQIEGYDPALNFGSKTGAVFITVENETGDVGFVKTIHEAQVVGGDSGSPLFRDDGAGGLELSGIAWLAGTTGSGVDERRVSVYSYLGNYHTQIQNYIDAHPVPEPSLGFLAGLAGVLGLVRRRRA